MSEALEEVKEIDKLAHALEIAKIAEKEAKEHRVHVETIIERLLEDEIQEEGTSKVPGSYYELSLKTGYNRKITEVQSLREEVGDSEFNKLCTAKFSLNMKYLNSLKDANHDMYMKVSKYIEAKPFKTQVSVKEII